jgi:hypothetical protein
MTTRRITDGYLVTSMINASHHFGPYPSKRISSEGGSRMPAYQDELAVRELIDLVAFLQSRYDVRSASSVREPYSY